jgi:peptide deformylase
MFRKILIHPNKKLRADTKQVENVEAIQGLIKDLIDTCNVEMGAGLAAPQIGMSTSVVVIKPKVFGKDNPDPSTYNEDYMVLINPELITQGELIEWKEACLSIPGVSGKVSRSETTLVKYTSETGEQKKFIAEWPFSGGLQHECDHLQGLLFIHRMDKRKAARLLETKRRIERKLKIKAKKQKRLALGRGKGTRK